MSFKKSAQLKLTVKSTLEYQTDITVGEIMPVDYASKLEEPEVYIGDKEIDALYKDISLPDFDRVYVAPYEVVITWDDIDIEAVLEDFLLTHKDIRQAWDEGRLANLGLGVGDIVEYDGMNWELRGVSYWADADLLRVDGYYYEHKDASFDEIKLVTHKPKDELEAARLLGKDEDLLGVSVLFNICNGYEDDEYGEPNEDYEEYTDEDADIWSAGLSWCKYAHNFRWGKTEERISSTEFTDADGTKTKVYLDDIFSEYEWEDVIEIFREERDLG